MKESILMKFIPFAVIALLLLSTVVSVPYETTEKNTGEVGSMERNHSPGANGRGEVRESEGNDASGTADEFAGGTPMDPLLVNGTLATDADIDWFKITVAGVLPGILNVSLEAPYNASVVPDYEFTVYEANDNTASKQFIYGTDSGWVNSDPTMKTAWAAGPGFYFVRIKVKEGTNVVTGDDYQFNFTYTTVADMLVESEILDKANANDEAGDANPMNLTGQTVREVDFFGTVRSDTDHDWFRLNLSGPSGGALNISFETFYRDATGAHNGHTYTLKLYGPGPGTEETDLMLEGTDTGVAGATLISGSLVPPGHYLMDIYDEGGVSFSPYEAYHLYVNYTPVLDEEPGSQLESELISGGGTNDVSGDASTVVLSATGGLHNGTFRGTMNATADVDWFNFTLPGDTIGNLDVVFDTPYEAGVLDPLYWYVLYRGDSLNNEYLNASGQGSGAPSFQETLSAMRPTEYYLLVSVAAGHAPFRSEPYSVHLSFEPDDSLQVELEHADGRDNNEPDNAENITMLPPGDGRSYHLGEMYGSIDSPGDADHYILNFTDAYVGTLTFYVQSPNYVASTLYNYAVYGPESTTYMSGYKQNYGSTGQESFTIPGGLPGEYMLTVTTEGVYDMAHLYHVRIEFEPEDTSIYQVAGIITGRVYNNFTSQSVVNIPVSVYNGDDTEKWGEFTSDASGNYATSKLPKQDVWLKVSTNGYAPYSRLVTMNLGEDQTVDIGLEPTYGNLDGYVYYGTYAHANYAVPNATVEIVGSSFSTLSDALGHYSFTNVPTGTHQVRFSADDHEPYTQSVQVLESQTATLHGYLTRMTGHLIVNLLDGEGQRVTSGASVKLFREETGEFSLSLGNYFSNYTFGTTNILIGNYTMTVVHQDYATVTMTVRVLRDRYSWVNVSLTNKRFIVLIYDAMTGAAITYANQFYVKLYSLSKSSVVPGDTTALDAALVSTATQLYDNQNTFYNDSSGYYWRFYNIENGDYLLNVTHVNWAMGNPSSTYLAYERRVTVEDRDLILNVSVTKPGLKLRIIDENTNASVTYATVSLKYNRDNQQYTLSYDSGSDSYKHEGKLGYGSYTLTISHGDFKGVTKIINITEPYTYLEVYVHQGRLKMTVEGGDEIYMHQENKVIVFVTDTETDEPLNGATITVSVGVYGNQYTNEQGRVEITVSPTNAAITKITFTASYAGYASKSLEFDIIVGEEPTTGRITGTAKYDSAWGSPVKKMEVDLYLGVPNEVIVSRLEPVYRKTTTTDDSGFFTFSNLSFEWYVICIGSHQDLRMSDDWASQYNSVELTLQNRFLTKDIFVSTNNPPLFKPRSKEDFANNANPNDQYKGKVYKEHVLDDERGDVFRIFVADADGDEPEYVRLNIDGKSYEMKALEKTNPDYTGDNVDDVLPRMEDGRYYEVAIKDLKSGTYNYSFSLRDIWSKDEVVKDGEGEIEIVSLREIFFRDNMKRMGVLGGCCILLFVIFLIARAKGKKNLYENENKQLTVGGIGYSLKELEVGASGEMVGDLNDYRVQFLEGRIDSAEFIKRLK